MLEDLKSWGAPESEIQRWREERAKETGEDPDDVPTDWPIVLPPDCAQACRIFLAVDTQWNRLLAGERLIATGLNYAGVREALTFLQLEPTPALFADLRLMENEALIAMAHL